MQDELLLKIGQKVRFERMKKNFSQEKLAELADLNTNSISTLERGINNVKIKTLFQIADALGIDAKDLLNFTL